MCLTVSEVKGRSAVVLSFSIIRVCFSSNTDFSPVVNDPVLMLKCSYLLAISFSGNILMLSIVGVKTMYGVQRTSKVGCDLFICLLVFYFGAERKSLGILK